MLSFKDLKKILYRFFLFRSKTLMVAGSKDTCEKYAMFSAYQTCDNKKAMLQVYAVLRTNAMEIHSQLVATQ